MEVCMIKNMGTIDRVIRIIIGLGLISGAVVMALTSQIWWAVGLMGVFGLIMIVTSSISWCPLYLPFKISTRKK
jgi:hypothetical protein